jgi:6-phosphogluconolactonase
MDELEWWEFDSPAEMAEQVAGDIGFVIERAVEAHGGARIALPSGGETDTLFKALLENKSIDWKKVTIIPTDDAVVPAGEAYATLQKAFGKSGAELVPLVDQSASGDAASLGRAADARLAALHWPLDLVCLTMGADGSTAAILPGPDLDKALAGPRERRAVGVRPDPSADANGDRVTLTAAAIISARAVMVVLTGDEKRRVLEQAIQEGPLSGAPVGRLLAELDAAIDIFWSAEGA